jgi:hypothetical protein
MSGELGRLLAHFTRVEQEEHERYRQRVARFVGKHAPEEVGGLVRVSGGEAEFERRIKELYVAERISAEDLDWAMAQVLSYWRRRRDEHEQEAR